MLRGKICYLDCETTGKDASRHAMIELALIVDKDGRTVGTETYTMAPFDQDEIDPEALEVNKRTVPEIRAFNDPVEMWHQITAFLRQFVDPYDKADKLQPAAYHGGFDIDFLKALWRKADHKDSGIYFGSYFNYRLLDPARLLPWLVATGQLNLPDYKLGTVCAHYGIELGDAAHGAAADTIATRELCLLLADRYLVTDGGF